MSKLDQMIAEALSAEDRAAMDQIKDPAFFGQLAGQFRGRDAWVTWASSIAILVFAGVALWSGWRFFSLADPTQALRSGLICLGAVSVIGMMKLYLLQQMQTDRVLRELRRVELLVVTQKG